MYHVKCIICVLLNFGLEYNNHIFHSDFLPNLPACTACLEILGISPNSTGGWLRLRVTRTPRVVEAYYVPDNPNNCDILDELCPQINLFNT